MITTTCTDNLIKNNIMNEFNLEEAVSLIYHLAVLKEDVKASNKKYDITQIGHVCGVLTLNDQIEVVIKFHDKMRQFTKAELYTEVKLLEKQNI